MAPEDNPMDEVEMTELDVLRELRDRSIQGEMYADFKVWSEPHDPRPVHPELGPQMCPAIVLWEKVPCEGTPIHVQQAVVHAHAAWESPTHDENKKALAIAEYLCACANYVRRQLGPTP